MAFANITATSFVENVSPLNANVLFKGAVSGDRECVNAAMGGPDFLITATQAAAESAALSVTFASLFGSAKPQVAAVTAVLIRARIYVGAALAANRAFWDVAQLFTDEGGAMTATAAATAITDLAVEGTAAVDPTLTNSGSNTLAVTIVTTGAVAHDVRVELYVTRFA